MRSRRLAARRRRGAPRVLGRRGSAPPSPALPPVRPRPAPSTPTGPISCSSGALLPLNGPGAWFGAEIKQGLELAAAELEPTPKRRRPYWSTETSLSEHGGPRVAPGRRRPARPGGPRRNARRCDTTRRERRLASTAGTSAAGASPASAGTSPAAAASTAGAPHSGQGSSGGTGAATASAETKKPGHPQIEPVEPPDRAADGHAGHPGRRRPAARREGRREPRASSCSARASVAIMTASPTPTLAVYPLAPARDVLVLHAGLADRPLPGDQPDAPPAAAVGRPLAPRSWARMPGSAASGASPS